MHALTINEEEAINLEESREEYTESLGGEKGRQKCCDYNRKNKQQTILLLPSSKQWKLFSVSFQFHK